jgi:hypothetical protein
MNRDKSPISGLENILINRIHFLVKRGKPNPINIITCSGGTCTKISVPKALKINCSCPLKAAEALYDIAPSDLLQ